MSFFKNIIIFLLGIMWIKELNNIIEYMFAKFLIFTLIKIRRDKEVTEIFNILKSSPWQ